VRLRLSAVVGVLAVLSGFLFLVQREFAAALSLEWTLVLLVAVVAGVQALRFVQNRRHSPLQATETPDPERRYEAPTPGDDADEALGIARGWSRRGRRSRTQLRERVGEAAVAAIVDTAGCSREEATERIRRGEWTDDDVAAWFLSDTVELGARERLRLLLGSPLSRFGAAFDRAVRAVEAYSEGESR
jgi:hypothetical protein